MSDSGGDRCSKLAGAWFRFSHIPIGKALRSNMVDRLSVIAEKIQIPLRQMNIDFFRR
jgi:hypothetical protein